MRHKRLFGIGAAAASMTLIATACSAPDAEEGGGADGDGGQPTSINVGWNQPFYAYNDAVSTGNNVTNVNSKYLMNKQFWYVDSDGAIQEDTDFGTYEQTSEDPLTVEYTVNEETAWSDGVPVDAADMLLWWAAGSGNRNTVESADVQRDQAGGAEIPGDQVFFDSVASAGFPLITETPELSEDGQGLTLVYDEPFADWQYDMDVNVPAHVVGQRALDIEDPEEAKQAVIDAIVDNDEAALTEIAAFWNTGFNYTSFPEDEGLRLSNGAYVMTALQENEFQTFERNEAYEGERDASFDTITIRYNEDPLAQVQALQNGEIDMFSPQVTVDVIEAAENADAEVQTLSESSYEHVDLVFNNGGPFDPATYGGDEETAQLVRQAFIRAIPREQIMDTLIRPIQEGAEVRNSFLVATDVPYYDEVAGANGSEEFAEADPAAALELLEQAGVETPVPVRVMYAAENERRASIFQLLQQAMGDAGFELVDQQDPQWSAKLGDGTYDAVYYAWQSPTPSVTSTQAIFGTGGGNNSNGYSNPEADALFEQLLTSTDETEQVELQTQIDQLLFDDAYGITLFQFPGANISNGSRVGNVDPSSFSPTMFYGFWDWEVPGS